MEVVLAENCKKISKIAVADLESTLGDDFDNGLLDSRHDVFSFNNIPSSTMYFNYLEIIREFAHSSTSGRYYGLLDIGFIPIFMPPMFFPYEAYAKDIVGALEYNNIPFYRLPASSFSKSSFMSDNPDIWVNKMDVAEFVNKRPDTIRVEDVLRRIGW